MPDPGARPASGAPAGPGPHPRVLAEIHGDLAFTVTDDLAEALDAGPGRPRPGYYGTLLGPDRWAGGAAVALGTWTVVEVWRDGHGVRQELSGIRPARELRSFDPPAGAGTRVALTLDPAYFAPGSAITTDLAGLDPHGPYCEAPPGPGSVTVRDLRDGREFRYR